MNVVHRNVFRFRVGPWLVLPLLLAAGCAQKAAEPTAGQPREQAAVTPTVTTARPVRKTLGRKVVQPGEIHAFKYTPMFARISGYVRKVYKDIGDPVDEGDVMAEQGVPEMVEELQQKGALVSQAKAEIEQARKLLASAEAEVKSADAKVREAEAGRLRVTAEMRRAESQYERLKKTTAVIAQEAIDETRLGFEAARAAVAEVEAKIVSAEADRIGKEAKRDKARTDISVAEAHLRVAEAGERYMAAMVQYAKLCAPFKGIVIRRKVDPGHFLQASTGGNVASAIFVVAQMDTVRVFVDVPENDAALVTDGTHAVVSVQALNGEEFSGEVTRSEVAVDPKVGRTLRTEIDLKNPGGRIKPGMYAIATLSVERKNVLTVPAAAVVTQGDQFFCYRLEGSKVLRTAIQVGIRDGQFIEVVKMRKGGEWEDFTGEERIITSNPAALTDGQVVAAVTTI